MNIALELPPGVPLPTLKGTLVGELDDLHIQIRFKDLLDTLKSAVDNGAGLKVNGSPNPVHNFEVPPKVEMKTPAPPKQAVAKKPAHKKVAPPPVQATPEASVDKGEYTPVPGTAAHFILGALAKKPLSSLEISEALLGKVSNANIYTTCSMLKGRNLIESIVDEQDGTRRWKLCPAK